ncbi:hypothetical protein N7532_006866 [Penicillium argentinense]|uniref:Uncharacterized protein n=1 Tax=Penicillium argentinense TaxID=1131581 RepID=A0A9W9FGW0_9EURO|nr:uncharacterized protein N7532_006866 [Penicillium argentinense]KAJ5099865.1 hypothetical protein N7532_006866 [Penicillium argentinense]
MILKISSPFKFRVDPGSCSIILAPSSGAILARPPNLSIPSPVYFGRSVPSDNLPHLATLETLASSRPGISSESVKMDDNLVYEEKDISKRWPDTIYRTSDMFCPPDKKTESLEQLEKKRARCSRLLKEPKARVWDENEDPSTRGGKRLYDKLPTFTPEGQYILPPKGGNILLSDLNVAMVINNCGVRVRSKHWPAIFDKSGDIKPDRVPEDPAPFAFAHGLPHIPVFRGYYLLCGREMATKITTWQLSEKTLQSRTPMALLLGVVIAPPYFMASPLEKKREINAFEKGAKILHGLRHDYLTLFFDPESNNYECQPLYEFPGYRARLSENFDHYVKPMRLSVEKLAANLKLPYARNHRVVIKGSREARETPSPTGSDSPPLTSPTRSEYNGEDPLTMTTSPSVTGALPEGFPDFHFHNEISDNLESGSDDEDQSQDSEVDDERALRRLKKLKKYKDIVHAQNPTYKPQTKLAKNLEKVTQSIIDRCKSVDGPTLAIMQMGFELAHDIEKFKQGVVAFEEEARNGPPLIPFLQDKINKRVSRSKRVLPSLDKVVDFLHSSPEQTAVEKLSVNLQSLKRKAPDEDEERRCRARHE